MAPGPAPLAESGFTIYPDPDPEDPTDSAVIIATARFGEITSIPDRQLLDLGAWEGQTIVIVAVPTDPERDETDGAAITAAAISAILADVDGSELPPGPG
jgi:hypothetical protein